ncbi:PEP-CTERM sorting domain-containing protein [Aquitalea pelogenes]|uniref:PEP-CTERM sorting domain-containing protein n=1 Tax=Aquitalea pelogenes TaxID=1293573 RepID=UPI0035B3024F
MKLASLLVSAALLASPLAHADLMQSTNNLLSQDVSSWTLTRAANGSGTGIDSNEMIFGGVDPHYFDSYSQTFNTVIGGTYALSFSANIHGSYGNSLQTLMNGSNIGGLTNGSGAYNETYNFTANTTSTILTFAGYNIPSWTSVSNIGVSQVAVSPVPEPETYALMGMGLLAITLKLRKKKQGQSSTALSV